MRWWCCLGAVLAAAVTVLGAEIVAAVEGAVLGAPHCSVEGVTQCHRLGPAFAERVLLC